MLETEVRKPSRPFDVDLAIERLREAVRPLPKAAMFQLADEGFDSLFEQVVACIISIRTYEETMGFLEGAVSGIQAVCEQPVVP